MTRREALQLLAATLAASPFLRLPEGQRCSCDMPLVSFEEWRDARPFAKVGRHVIGFEGTNDTWDFTEGVDRLAHAVDQNIFHHYARLTCPIHGEARFGGPRPDSTLDWDE